MEMRDLTYVLVPGAWHGGWVWKDVAALLRSHGVAVTTPTLTGLGERRKDSTESVGFYTHIEELISHVFMKNIENPVLVGWSYGSFVAAGVAAQLAGRMKSIIYVD